MSQHSNGKTVWGKHSIRKGEAQPAATSEQPVDDAAPGNCSTDDRASVAPDDLEEEAGDLLDGKEDEPSPDALEPDNDASGDYSGYVKTGDHEYVSIAPDPGNPDMVVIRTRERVRMKQGKGKHSSKKKRFALILGVLFALLLGVIVCLALLINTGRINLHNPFEGLQQTPEEIQVQNEGELVEYNGHYYQYNPDVVSVVLIGHDDETDYVIRKDSSCADAIMLLAMDTSTNKLKCIVVPRNSYVDVDVYKNDDYVDTRTMPITLSYAVDVSSEDQCATNTTTAVSRVFYSLPISYYFSIDEQAFAEATDAVGGVTVKALSNIPGAGYSKGDTVELHGDEAFRYIQYRDIYEYESALDRQERQIQFVKAFAAKARGIGVEGIMKLYKVISNNSVTNLGVSEISYLASCFVAGGDVDLDITSLKGVTKLESDSDGIERENYYLDRDSVMQCMLDAFYVQID